MTEWIEAIIRDWGPAGVAFLMFVENLFPPLPSEVVLPLAGYRVAEGDLSLLSALIAGSAGSLAGVTLWYLAALWLGARRMQRFARKRGRWLTLTPDDLDKVNAWFATHGSAAVLVGRLVPGIRTLISIPAGICGMPPARFLLFSAIGTAIWSTALLLAGYYLGEHFERVDAYVGPIGDTVLVVLLAWYLYRVATFGRRVEQS